MLQLTPSHKEGPGHPATMELIHLPMPEEKEGGSLEDRIFSEVIAPA